MTLPPTPKNQHYVWQHYLEPWAPAGTIVCYRQRERKAFRANTKNVASETYFYRTYDLTPKELAYLEATIASRPPLTRSSHRGFLAIFSVVTKLRQLLARYGKPDPAIIAQSQALLDQAERSLGEMWHVAVEQKGMLLLAQLRQRDVSFWGDDEAATDFSLFLATQYLRTARMRNAVVGAVATAGIDIARVWSIESHFWSTEIGAALFANRARYRMVMLANDTDVPFITGDQPAINLNAASVTDMKIYYPVTPTTALLLTVEAHEQDRDLSCLEAERYNHAIYSWSDDQLYGLDAAYLKALAATEKTLVL